MITLRHKIKLYLFFFWVILYKIFNFKFPPNFRNYWKISETSKEPLPFEVSLSIHRDYKCGNIRYFVSPGCITPPFFLYSRVLIPIFLTSRTTNNRPAFLKEVHFIRIVSLDQWKDWDTKLMSWFGILR